MILPSDVGLPPRFRQYDPEQYRAIQRLCSLRSLVGELEAPTGSGKTVIAFSYAKLRNERFLYLCSTKALQDQAIGDFASAGVSKVVGHGNFSCARGSIVDGVESWECDAGDQCEWKMRLREAREKDGNVANYAVWLSLQKSPMRSALGRFGTVILDEAHLVHDQVVQQMAVKITREQITTLTRSTIAMIDTNASTNAIYEWAVRLRNRSERYSRALEGSQSAEAARLLRRHTVFESDLSRLMANLTPTRWCLTGDSSTRIFTPLWAKSFVRDYLLPADLIMPSKGNSIYQTLPVTSSRHRAQVILASATLPPSISRRLNLDGLQTRITVPSSFPPERRPVYIIRGTPRLSYRMPYAEFEKWIDLLDSILAPRLDRKCIISAHSYERCAEILEASRYANHMLTHERGQVYQALQTYRASTDPLILLSPAIAEGYNFPYELCRLLVIAKVPFLNTRYDPLSKMRQKEDRLYAPEIVAAAIDQAAGRGMRRPDDWCEIAILDGFFLKLMKRRKLFSAAFRQAWKVVDQMPKPIPLDWR